MTRQHSLHRNPPKWYRYSHPPLPLPHPHVPFGAGLENHLANEMEAGMQEDGWWYARSDPQVVTARQPGNCVFNLSYRVEG